MFTRIKLTDKQARAIVGLEDSQFQYQNQELALRELLLPFDTQYFRLGIGKVEEVFGGNLKQLINIGLNKRYFLITLFYGCSPQVLGFSIDEYDYSTKEYNQLADEQLQPFKALQQVEEAMNKMIQQAFNKSNNEYVQ